MLKSPLLVLMSFVLILSGTLAQAQGYYKIKKITKTVISDEMSWGGGPDLGFVSKGLAADGLFDLPKGSAPPLVPVGPVPNQPRPQYPYPHYPTEDYPEYGTTGSTPLDVINTALKVWEIVKENKPVVDVDSKNFFYALPLAIENGFEETAGWQPERNVKIEVAYKNFYGFNVVKFVYQIKLIYGGTVDGKGLYIAAARITPLTTSIGWGYTFSVQVSNPITMNIRSRENPLAAIQIDVRYQTSTILKDETIVDTYQVSGDGKILDTENGEVLAGSVLRMR